METSFMSEHSAELILVPKLITELSSEFPKITPVYFWSYREGGVMSRLSFQNKSVRVLALYPRRPKISSIHCGKITIKINEILIERARYFHMSGIVAIAGAPLIDSLDDLSLSSDCMWFDLKALTDEEIFEIDIATRNIQSPPIEPLSVNSIADMIKKSQVFDWPEAIKKIRESGRSATRTIHYNRMSGDRYKPVYLLIHEW